MASSRGALIVFEGVDRSGKSTQSARLVERLNAANKPAVYMRFPDRTTPIGQMINAYLQRTADLPDEAIHLLYSANRWELKATIEEHLRQQTTVIVDRYAYSGVAFTSAKGLDLGWCKAPDRGLPKPDVVLLLDLPIGQASLRGSYGEERYELEDFQRRVQQQYALLKQDDPSWQVVDACQKPDALSDHLFEVVQAVIEQSAHKPLGSLWLE